MISPLAIFPLLLLMWSVSGTDNKYYYNIRLTDNNVIVNDSSAIYNFRYSDTSTINAPFSANLKFPIDTK